MGKLLVLCSLALLAAAGVMDNYLQSRNTLERNGRWVDSRLELVGMFANTLTFMQTRLMRNVLYLRDKAQYAEVLFEKPILPGRIAFDFSLLGDNYVRGKNCVICVFNKGPEGFEGVRISPEAESPNIYFVATPEGRFLHRQNLENVALRPGWNEIVVLPSSRGLEVRINGSAIGAIPTRFKTGLVGVRGYGRPAQVDNIYLEDGRGQAIVRETFNHWRTLRGGTLLSALLLSLLAIALAWRWHASSASLKPIFVTGALAIAWWFLSYLNFNFPFNASPSMPVPARLQADEFKNAAIRWTRKFPRLAANNGYADNPSNVDPSIKPFRILCLVSSQMAGVGAASLEQSCLRRLQTELNRYASPGRPYECFLVDAVVTEGTDVIDMFQRQWSPDRFDGAILALDPDRLNLETFEKKLSSFLEANAHGIPIVIVCSAGSPPLLGKETSWPPFIKEVGARFGVPVVDLHQYLWAHDDDGLLWWDYAHLTSFGQELMVSHIMENLEKSDGHFPGVRRKERAFRTEPLDILYSEGNGLCQKENVVAMSGNWFSLTQSPGACRRSDDLFPYAWCSIS